MRAQMFPGRRAERARLDEMTREVRNRHADSNLAILACEQALESRRGTTWQQMVGPTFGCIRYLTGRVSPNGAARGGVMRSRRLSGAASLFVSPRGRFRHAWPRSTAGWENQIGMNPLVHSGSLCWVSVKSDCCFESVAGIVRASHGWPGFLQAR